MGWYIAKLKPRSEERVKTLLERHGIEVWAPEIVVLKQRRNAMEHLFPGYAFVKLDPAFEQWGFVRWTSGLSYLLPAHSHPQAVSESLVQRVHAQVERWNAGGWYEGFKKADQVLINHGPRTLDAIFERYVPSSQRCEVLIFLIDRPSLVRVDTRDVHSFTPSRRFGASIA